MANFCTQSIMNTGEGDCRVLIAKAKAVMLVPMVDSTGATPSLDPSTDILNDAFVVAKINEANPVDRWYPVNNIRVATDERGDDEYFTYPDGTREFLRKGARTVTLTRGSGTPQMVKKLNSWASYDGGFYIVDENGQLRGLINPTGMLEPFPFEDNTFNAKLVVGNDTQKFSTIMLTFDYSNLVDDGDFGVFQTDSDVNLLRKEGLYDLNVTKGASTTTTLALTIDNGAGYVNNRVPQEGLLLADFTAYNVTTAASVTITGVTEATAGNYVLTFAAQTLADVMRITIAKTGIETNVSNHTL